MTDQNPIAAAILTALNAVPGVDAYDLDEAPGNTDAGHHVVISLYRDPSDQRRLGGAESVNAFFLEATYRADSVYNCRELRRLTCLALEDVALGDIGPLVFNQETQPIDDDPAGGWTGADTFRLCS